MTSTVTTIRQRAFGPVLELDNVRVSLTRNTESDQLYVLITTEGNDEVADDGSPLIQVDLNDATLYDREAE